MSSTRGTKTAFSIGVITGWQFCSNLKNGSIDPDQLAMPVLLKRYLAQNAKVLAFNRDPQFNDAIDGLIVLDLHDLPQDTRAGLEQALR